MTLPPSSDRPVDFETVRKSAREHEPDRYLSALLAPRDVRDDLIALAAVVGEIERIGRLVREPHLGEIRMQWWRDALLTAGGATSGNPIADRFHDVVRRRNLPRAALEDWFEVHATSLYPMGPADRRQLEAELTTREGVPFAFAAAISGAVEIPDHVLSDAALAYGAARLGVNFPYECARERIPLPGEFDARGARDYIAGLARPALLRVKNAFAGLERAQKCAILPVALVEPYLRALERADHDLARDVAEIAPLTRVWRFQEAHATGRI